MVGFNSRLDTTREKYWVDTQIGKKDPEWVKREIDEKHRREGRYREESEKNRTQFNWSLREKDEK